MDVELTDEIVESSGSTHIVRIVSTNLLRKFVVFLRVHTCKFRNGFVHSKVYQNHRVTVSGTFEYPAAAFTVTLTDM